MTWNMIILPHHQKFDQIELGDQNSQKNKIGGSKSWLLK
jgi:hypothetical protein